MSLVIKSSKNSKPNKTVKIALCIFNAIFCFIVFTAFIRIFTQCNLHCIFYTV